jgi:ABC-type sulfate transport system substrate-binding protein
VFCSTKATAQDSLLKASYDVSRELYRDINVSFAADWKAKTGRSVEIRQSHAGSSVQARAVIAGLEADVVTFNQVTDLNALVKAKLVSKDGRPNIRITLLPVVRSWPLLFGTVLRRELKLGRSC